MSSDAQLLSRYVTEKCEIAFTELVNRHVDLVYSAALRQADGNAEQAEDLTQAVFLELARRAADLVQHPALAGWLYSNVRNIAANMRRSEKRRERREQESCAMKEMLSAFNDPEWRQLRPVLDDAMHDLSEADRAAVVLRFFEEQSLREVGMALGVNENAARMRVERALEKLRAVLAQRGIHSTASGLTAALAAGAVISAPSGLAASISSTALSSSALAASTTTTIVHIMNTTNLKIALVGAVALAVAVPAWQETRVKRLTEENKQLQTQAAQLPELHREVERLRKSDVDRAELDRLRATQPELLQLRARVNSGRRTEAEVAQLRSELKQEKERSPITNQFSGAIGDFAKGMMEQQMTVRLARLKTKLHLTPEQEQRIAGFMHQQTEQSVQMAEKMFSGKMNRDDMAKAGNPGLSQDDQIKSVLSPEQQTAYQEFKQEEMSGNARLAANAEMLQLQGALGLSQEQQDQVFKVLYDHTMKQMNGASEIRPNPNNVDGWLDEQINSKVKALENILGADQVENYRRMQEAQLKMIKAMMPKTELPSPPTVGPPQKP